MLRRIIVIGFLLISAFVWGQTPLSNYHWREPTVKFKGKLYLSYEFSVADSYREASRQIRFTESIYSTWTGICFFYDTYTYYDGDSDELVRMLLEYIEKESGPINYSETRHYDDYKMGDGEYNKHEIDIKRIMEINDWDICLAPDGYGCYVIYNYNRATKKYDVTVIYPYDSGA